MEKKLLKFKVPGGLDKVSEFYASHGGTREAIETYWKDPAAMLQHFVDQPVPSDIKLSGGYKKLADTLDTLDFNGLSASFDDQEAAVGCTPLNAKAAMALWEGVNGDDATGLMASAVKDTFNNALTMTIMITITITVTITVTSGRPDQDKIPERAPAVPKFNMRNMAHHAQIVADQIGWFS